MATVTFEVQPEMYFGENDEGTPVDFYSPRNEVETFDSIISLLDLSLSSCTPAQFSVLQELRKAVIHMIHEYGNVHSMVAKTLENSCEKGNCLLEWGESNGVRTSLKIACKSSPLHFLGNIRIIHIY